MRSRYIRVSDYRIKEISCMINGVTKTVYAPVDVNDVAYLAKRFPTASSITDVLSYEVKVRDKISVIDLINACPELMLTTEE